MSQNIPPGNFLADFLEVDSDFSAKSYTFIQRFYLGLYAE